MTMKRIMTVLAVALALVSCTPKEKEIYIPKDLQEMDLNDPESEYCYDRMVTTENFAIFWEKGFGTDLSNPPTLEGKDMYFDMENLKAKLETFYDYFYNTLGFARKGSKCDRYRMLVMVRYSLEGTAYGGDYDGEIGALWVTPNRIQDERLNCIAHELGHSFQSQITCDGEGDAWGGCGFFEMTSQWMLWQVNPDWIRDEPYHWDGFTSKCHKAYLHLTNIYHSPYILEHWGDKRGLKHIAELYREGRIGEDPAMTYMRVNGLSQEEFCDEMFEASCRIVNLDYPRAWKETRPYANRFSTKLEETADGWKRIVPEQCPEDYGFNAIALPVPGPGETVSVEFKGCAGIDGFVCDAPEKAGWRYGFVAVEPSEDKTTYGEMHSAKEGFITFTAPDNGSLSHLWLVVMGAPSEHMKDSENQWPYLIKVGK